MVRRVAGRVAGRVVGRVAGRVAGRLAGRVAGWVVGMVAGWVACRVEVNITCYLPAIFLSASLPSNQTWKLMVAPVARFQNPIEKIH